MATGHLADPGTHVVVVVNTSKMRFEVVSGVGGILFTASAVVSHGCLIGGDVDVLDEEVLVVPRKESMTWISMKKVRKLTCRKAYKYSKAQ